jgi:hypothetical protein
MSVQGGPSRRWLSDIARLADALAALPSVIQLVGAAEKAAAGDPKRFEDVLVDLLVESATLSADVVAASVTLEDLPPVTGFHVEKVPGSRRPCDAWLVWEHAESETRVPANVKLETDLKATRRNFAVALGPLLSWLTDADGSIDRARRGLDPDRALIELLAGTRKLHPGRDYLLFIAYPGNGKSGRVAIRSLVARHALSGTGLALARHGSRDVVVYQSKWGEVIGADCDIARELAVALLPTGGATRLAAELLALTPPSKRRRLAKALLDVPVDVFLDGITDTLER